MTDYPTCCHACGRARDSKAERKWRKAIREENAKLWEALEKSCGALGCPTHRAGSSPARMTVEDINGTLDLLLGPVRMGDIAYTPVPEATK